MSVSIFGILQSKKNKSADDFILTNTNTSWITVMFSIVATETSVLTFISVPGISYRGDWTFLQLAIGYIFGRVIVALFLLPDFFKKGIFSIYQVLEKSFGKKIQKLASLTFLITRLLADSVRFLATAIILQSITGWSIIFSVLLIAFVTLIYTILGGLRAVIKIDAFQFIIYIISAFICIFYILQNLDMSFNESIVFLYNSDKMKTFQFTGNIFSNPFMFVSAFIGGTMLSFASHGADYMMVQRVLATKNINSARKAMIGSGFFVLFQFTIFLFIGSLIYLVGNCNFIEKDREISYVLKNFIPIGFKGIVMAGILSTGMSTLSSSINSLTSTTIKDWFPSIKSIKTTRFISVFWTFVLVILSCIFIESNNSLVIIGLKIASYTYGCLLSFFILSKFKIKFKVQSILIGYVSAILSVLYLMKYQVSWTFYILGSVITFVIITIIFEKISKYIIIRDLLMMVIFFALFSLFPFNNKEITYSKIIDLKIKDTCLDEKVFLGSDIMKEYPEEFDYLDNVGLVINHTSDFIHLDKYQNIVGSNFKNTNIKVIFTPEHGFLGESEAGEKIDDSKVDNFNIPIVSLYGEKYKPHEEELIGLDAIIFDIQDVGSRYYTYVSTMTNVMKTCAIADIPLIIFDRPNPLSGKIGGPILDMNFSSFVGMHPIPIRHGMTIGELAYMINELGWLGENLKVDLRIMKMQGWNRSMYFEETGLKWVSPSPNIPDIQTSFIYNGMCLIEGTNLSEGRGTDFPFMQFGAPWLNAEQLVTKLNSKNLKGVSFNSVDFIPKSIPSKATHPKFKDKLCKGVRIEVKDKTILDPLQVVIYILYEVYLHHPEEFKFLSNNFIDKLFGSDKLRNYILSGKKVEELIKEYEYDQENFKEISSKFLLY